MGKNVHIYRWEPPTRDRKQSRIRTTAVAFETTCRCMQIELNFFDYMQTRRKKSRFIYDLLTEMSYSLKTLFTQETRSVDWFFYFYLLFWFIFDHNLRSAMIIATILWRWLLEGAAEKTAEIPCLSYFIVWFMLQYSKITFVMIKGSFTANNNSNDNNNGYKCTIDKNRWYDIMRTDICYISINMQTIHVWVCERT